MALTVIALDHEPSRRVTDAKVQHFAVLDHMV